MNLLDLWNPPRVNVSKHGPRSVNPLDARVPEAALRDLGIPPTKGGSVYVSTKRLNLWEARQETFNYLLERAQKGQEPATAGKVAYDLGTSTGRTTANLVALAGLDLVEYRKNPQKCGLNHIPLAEYWLKEVKYVDVAEVWLAKRKGENAPV